MFYHYNSVYCFLLADSIILSIINYVSVYYMGGGISMPYLQIANYGIITDMCK